MVAPQPGSLAPSTSGVSAGEALLSVRGVRVRFGGITALDGVDLEVRPGQVVGLVGPNGSGKTTLLNVVSRLYAPCAGSVDLQGVNLLRVPVHGIARLGIARTFQNLALFPAMTVLDNVVAGLRSRAPGSPRG